jgi:hypothetical protein
MLKTMRFDIDDLVLLRRCVYRAELENSRLVDVFGPPTTNEGIATLDRDNKNLLEMKRRIEGAMKSREAAQ